MSMRGLLQCLLLAGMVSAAAPAAAATPRKTPPGGQPPKTVLADVTGPTESQALPPVASLGAQSGLAADRDASRNWQRAGMLSVGGIPDRSSVCATVSPQGNNQDDTIRIQSAIAACPSGKVVLLSGGTFTIAEGRYVLLNRDVTLRGSGAGVTILQRQGGASLGSYQPGSAPSPLVIVGPMRWNNGLSTTALQADTDAGADSVVVDNPAGFKVGQIVLLDEASGADWQADAQGLGRIWASPDYRVVWQKHDPPQSWDDFSAASYPFQPGTAACWFSDCDRPTNEIKRIAAISGNVVRFDSPVMISYRVSHQAALHRWQIPHTQNAGLEDLTVTGGDDGNVKFLYCAYCWAKGVENSLWLGDGFGVGFSFRVQLQGIYVHNPVWPLPGGGGYNISLAWGSSEVLVQDSISVLTNKVIVARSAGAGSVVAYNYVDEGYIGGQEGWVETGLNASHMVGSHHVLFEGNYTFNIDSDQTHGNSTYHTFFRNYASGYRAPFRTLWGKDIDDTTFCCGPLRAASAHGYAYWMSFIGNVLGTPGLMRGWAYETIGGRNIIPSPGIWMLGWFDISPQGYDPQVAATAIRNGNFDFLTGKVEWAPNTSKTLASSLYLTKQPDFFAGYTWPWVDPTGLQQQIYALPAKARFNTGTPTPSR